MVIIQFQNFQVLQVYLRIIILKTNFIPKNIKNTCLIYNSSDKFFHGFKTIARNGHRKAITFQFLQDDIYENLNG